MGIFKNITRALKKAAPVIGSAIGMFYGGPLGASIGSGIGSLAAGRSAEEALQNAALAGASTYAMGGKDFGKGFNFDTSGSPFASSQMLGSGEFADTNVISSVKQADTGGIGSFLKGMIPESTAGKVALGGAGIALLGGLGEEEKEEERKMPPFPEGKTRLGYGRIGNKLYNLDNEEEREKYFEDNRNRGIFAAAGGEIKGPGTGTSDSVPARLSDGEFVLTAKAVRGAGGGDRNIGAARMYDMMSQLEGAA
tara:strand:+ start:202 stop:957 length:756 start_codon:yes stop_codon:yes gene_type:complete